MGALRRAGCRRGLTLGGATGETGDCTLGSGTGGLSARPRIVATLEKAFRIGGPKERGAGEAVEDLSLRR